MKPMRVDGYVFHVVGSGRNAYLRMANPSSLAPNGGYIGSINEAARIRKLRDYLTKFLRSGDAGGAKP